MLLLALIGLVIGAIAGGGQGAFWGAIIGFILGAGLRGDSSNRKTAKSPSAKSPPKSAPPRATAPAPRPMVEPLKWVGPGVPIEIQGRQISAGMFYLLPARTNVWEPSAINARTRAGAGAVGQEANLPYWPAYDSITPAQRGAYLDWLAAGRRDSNPAARDFGYLFLFFYGLERRVLVEEDYSSEIGHEIAQLVTVYASFGRSKSLPSYFCQLLHFWAHRQGEERYAELWPWILKLEHGVLDEDELGLVLRNIAQRGGTVPPLVAREIAYHDPEAIRSNVTSRSPLEFARLFDERFTAEFPAGMKVVPKGNLVVAKYRPASAALRDLAESGKLSARTKGAEIPETERARLIGVWNSCCEDLLGYMRAKAKSAGRSTDMATIAATPAELRSSASPGLILQLDEFLLTAAKEESWRYSTAAPLFTFFGEPARGKFTLTQSRQLAGALSALGWLMEPDPRKHEVGLEADQELVLFRGSEEPLSSDFLGHCGIIQLAAFIAGSDGSFDIRENEVLSLLVENAAVSEHEKVRLRAWSALLSRNLDSAPLSITRIARVIPAEKAQAVAQMLCRIASADGIVTKNEEKALQRLFKNLGLTAESIAEFERYLSGFEEVKVSVAEPEEAGEPIPQAPRKSTKPALTIDRERLRQLTAETNEVIHILSVAMADPEHPPEQAQPAAQEAKEEVAVATADIPAWCEGLPDMYAPLLVEVAARESWSRAEFADVARRHHVMSSAAYDAINEWSDDKLGDFLLSGEDPVTVNRSLIPS